MCYSIRSKSPKNQINRNERNKIRPPRAIQPAAANFFTLAALSAARG